MYLPRSVAARVMITDIHGTQRGAAARLGGGGYDRILGRRHTCASCKNLAHGQTTQAVVNTILPIYKFNLP